MLGLKQEMGHTGGCFHRECILVGRPKVSKHPNHKKNNPARTDVHTKNNFM